MSDEKTLKQEPSARDILEAVLDVSRRLDASEKSTNAQFEAIRKGIVANSMRFDRLEAKVHSVRSDISNLKAAVIASYDRRHDVPIRSSARSFLA